MSRSVQWLLPITLVVVACTDQRPAAEPTTTVTPTVVATSPVPPPAPIDPFTSSGGCAGYFWAGTENGSTETLLLTDGPQALLPRLNPSGTAIDVQVDLPDSALTVHLQRGHHLVDAMCTDVVPATEILHDERVVEGRATFHIDPPAFPLSGYNVEACVEGSFRLNDGVTESGATVPNVEITSNSMGCFGGGRQPALRRHTGPGAGELARSARSVTTGRVGRPTRPVPTAPTYYP